MNDKLLEEFKINQNPYFQLGESIYMGMARVKGKTVVISVGYKIDYTIRKGKENAELLGCTLLRINKVKIGELEAFEKFNLTNK